MTSYYKKIHWSIISLVTISSLCFCEKNWLEEKSDISLTIPSTIKDLQALLDNSSVFNAAGSTLTEISADNIYLTPSAWEAQYVIEKNAYSWKPDIYEGETTLDDWKRPYARVYYANIVLEAVDKIIPDDANEAELNNIKGSALFYRAFSHYEVATMFALPYTAGSAATDLGIPLRLSSDFNIPSARASVRATYEQIIDDLREATHLLPIAPSHKTRPGKPAVFAMLSRIYLSMEDYVNAKICADSSLAYNDELLNYNSLNPASSVPFPSFASNIEILFFSTTAGVGTFLDAYVDTGLYKQYAIDDLRKTVFFSSAPPTVKFKGNYNTLTLLRQFNGLATDELYLIQAECLARNGQTQPAMNVLNTLLRSRWATGTFTDLVATDAEDALRQILAERRKELLFRGLRWADLRRLNRDDRFKVTLTREINGEVHTLPPGDLRYVQLLPPDVMLYSGMQQNPR